MHSQENLSAAKFALVAFSAIFFVCMFKGASVYGACSRGALVALGVFFAAKLILHFFFHALVDALSDFMNKESNALKGKD